MSKQNIVLLLFLFIGLLYLLWIVFKMFQKSFCSRPIKEHFTTTEEETLHDSTYTNRMNVMKVFDTVLNRKPTSVELEKYSAIHNEQDLLVAILSENKIEEETVVEALTEESKSYITSEETLTKLENIVKKPIENDTKVKQSTKVLEHLSHITTAVEEIKKLIS